MKAIRRIQWSSENRGIIGTLTSSFKSIGRRFRKPVTRAAHHFDIKNGVATDGLIPGHDLAVGHANDRFIAGYAAIPPSRFLGAMEKWKASGLAHAVEEYTFINFGCGKGRAALLASQLGFRNVVGIELNTRLAELATSNAEVWTAAGKILCTIQIVCGDALELSGPKDLYWSTFDSNPEDLELVYKSRNRRTRLTKYFS